MHAVDAEDLAEEMLSHRGRLAQVDPFQVEAAAFELLGRADDRRFLGREVERGIALGTQILIFRLGV